MTDNKNCSPFIPMFFHFVYPPESYVPDLVRTCRTIVISVSTMGVGFQWFESLSVCLSVCLAVSMLLSVADKLYEPNRPRLNCRVSGHVSVNYYSQQGNYPALRVVSLLVFFSRLLNYTIFVFFMGFGPEIHFLYFFSWNTFFVIFFPARFPGPVYTFIV